MTPEDSLDLLKLLSTAASGYLTYNSHTTTNYCARDGEAEGAYGQPRVTCSSQPAPMSPVSPGHGLSKQVALPRLAQWTGEEEEEGWQSAWLRDYSHLVAHVSSPRFVSPVNMLRRHLCLHPSY